MGGTEDRVIARATSKFGAGAREFSPLDALIEPQPWTKDALCAETDPEMFFPDKGGSTREAKKVCGSCDVVEECLAYALDHGERFGIWGALSERERSRLRRQRRGIGA